MDLLSRPQLIRALIHPRVWLYGKRDGPEASTRLSSAAVQLQDSRWQILGLL